MIVKPSKNGPIIPAQQIGGDLFHIGRNLNGEFIFSINNQSIRMSPAQAQDLAVRLLRSLGMEIEEVPPAPGPRLVG